MAHIWVLSVLAALTIQVSCAQASGSLPAPLPQIQGEVNGMKVVVQGDTAAFFAGMAKPLETLWMDNEQGSGRLHNSLQANRMELLT